MTMPRLEARYGERVPVLRDHPPPIAKLDWPFDAAAAAAFSQAAEGVSIAPAQQQLLTVGFRSSASTPRSARRASCD